MSDKIFRVTMEPLHGGSPVNVVGREDDLRAQLREMFPTIIPSETGDALTIHQLVAHLESRIQPYLFSLSSTSPLQKAWPRSEAENRDNQAGFVSESPPTEDRLMEQFPEKTVFPEKQVPMARPHDEKGAPMSRLRSDTLVDHLGTALADEANQDVNRRTLPWSWPMRDSGPMNSSFAAEINEHTLPLQERDAEGTPQPTATIGGDDWDFAYQGVVRAGNRHIIRANGYNSGDRFFSIDPETSSVIPLDRHTFETSSGDQTDRLLIEHLNKIFAGKGHLFKSLAKGWPKDQKENEENRKGFFGSPEWQVAEDQHLEAGGGVRVRWDQEPLPSMESVHFESGRSPRSVAEEAGPGRYPAMVASAAGADSRLREALSMNSVADGQLVRDPVTRNWNLGPRYGMGDVPEPANQYYGWRKPRRFEDGWENEVDQGHRNDAAYWEGISNAAGIEPEEFRHRPRTQAAALKSRVAKEKAAPFRTRDVPPVKKKEENLQQLVEDMLGFNPHRLPEFRAARLLAQKSRGNEPTLEQCREALFRFPNDKVSAALQAMGLAITESNRDALLQIQQLHEGKPTVTLRARDLTKGEGRAVTLSHIRAVDDDSSDLEQALQQASAAGEIEEVKLSGRHSDGTLLAQTEHFGNWLLKPGSGQQSPAAGARQDQSSQSQREAAFWHVARRWGLSGDFPRTELFQVDGRQYAAIQMLDWSWKNLAMVDAKDHRRAVSAVDAYRTSGTLHRWAVLDFVLGNPDRHGQNMMIGPENQLVLIDHGSAFAGTDFDPARDKKSFIPFYLRITAPEAWVAMSPKEKMRYMPVIPQADIRQHISRWVAELEPQVLSVQLQHFGIDPTASLQRLAALQKHVAAAPQHVDKIINQMWVL